ncbi:MAG TPA: hypothetical protein VJW77_00790 [Terriglobia bacterium]|nr:hypothetical protein [Terriglobia bacterium]
MRFIKDLVLAVALVMAASAYACAAGHSTTLTWGASVDTGVTYNVYRATGSCPASGIPSGATKITSGLTALTYLDTNVSAGNVFAYYVTAQLNGVESGPSNCADATTKVGAPGTLAAVPN